MSIKKLSIYIILFLTVTISLPWHQGSFQVVAQAGYEKKVVLIDEAHDQYFNSTNLSKAIASIEDTEKAVVHTTKKKLSDEVLAGVDLLIIANPGSNAQTLFTQLEKKAIADWIKTGDKSLFLLSNPYDAAEGKLSGNPVPLNDLMASTYLQVGDTRFYEEGTSARGPDVIRNGTELGKPPSIQELLYPKVKKTALQLINSSYDSLTMLARSSSLVADQKLILTGFNTYSIGQGGIPDLEAENPCILGVSLLESNSKVALAGSSLMFSDLESPEGVSWFDSQDNSIFFGELINWLLGIIPIPQPVIPDWAIAVPAAIGLAGIAAILAGTALSRVATPISAEKVQETLSIETVPLNAKEPLPASSGGLSKRQRKFAQRKKAMQQKSNKKRKE